MADLSNVLDNVEQDLKNHPVPTPPSSRVEPIEKYIPSKYRNDSVTWETLQQEGRKLAADMEAHRQRTLDFINNHYKTVIDDFKRTMGG